MSFTLTSSSPTTSQQMLWTNPGSQVLIVESVVYDTTKTWFSADFGGQFSVNAFGGTRSFPLFVNPSTLPVGVNTLQLTFNIQGGTTVVYTVSVTINAGITYNFPSTDVFANGSRVLSLVEGNAETTTWRLASIPTAPVTITFTDEAALESGFTLAPKQVVLDSTNWNTPQNVLVTANQNPLVEGQRTYRMNTAITSPDTAFAALTLPEFYVRIDDDDSPGIFFSKSAFAITEGGATDTFNVRLLSRPTVNVVLTFPTHVQFKINPPTVTFTSINFGTNVPVTVTAVNDIVVEGFMRLTRVLATVTTADPTYSTQPVPTATFDITDNDIRVLAISPTLGPDVGGTVVSVHLSGAVTLDPASITFPGFTLVSRQVVGPSYVPPNDNTFVRSIECKFGTLAVPATILGPRTVSCVAPECATNTLEATKKCFSPVNMDLYVTTQDAASFPQYTYYWGAPDTNVTGREAWQQSKSRIYSISPTIVDMGNPQYFIINGSHFASDTVITDNARSILPRVSGAKPWVRIGGFLCSEATFVDLGDGGEYIRALSPKRKDLEGPTSNVFLPLEVSFNGYDWWQAEESVNQVLGYSDQQRKFASTAWTLFFVSVNVAFFVFFLVLLKGWICANFCARCVRQEDDEEKSDLDIRGPKLVSEYLKSKIEERLSKDKAMLADLRRQAENDAELRKKMVDAGYEDWEDEEETAERAKNEALAAQADARVREHKASSGFASRPQSKQQDQDQQSIEMTGLAGGSGRGAATGSVAFASIHEEDEGEEEEKASSRGGQGGAQKRPSANGARTAAPSSSSMVPFEVESHGPSHKKSKKDKKEKRSKKDKKEKHSKRD